MLEKKAKSKVDQANDIAFATVHKQSGIKPMDLFMAAMGYAGAGLSLITTNWMPDAIKILGLFLIGIGIVAMVLIARKPP